MPGRVTAFVIGGIAQAEISPMRARLTAALAQHEPKLAVLTWAELSPYYRDVMKLQDSVLGFVVGIIFVLVVAGVVNSMLMSVFERTREIGTLMSIGFRRRRIMALFLMEATVLSTIASFVGAIAGAALIAIANHHGLAFYIPAVGDVLNRPELSAVYIVIACVGASAGGIAGGLLPALRASRLRPIEALRAV
jgi:putative ABC transport system permease protein